MSAYLDHSASDAAEWEPFFREPHLTLVEYARDLEQTNEMLRSLLAKERARADAMTETTRAAAEALADVSRPYRVGRAS